MDRQRTIDSLEVRLGEGYNECFGKEPDCIDIDNWASDVSRDPEHAYYREATLYLKLKGEEA